jgi:UDP-N-acetylglucosamine--N-acetylmuramyl-(pentapeptide) pyrophosphoryl-undecaprenol N-acetylglucosamine transferase
LLDVVGLQRRLTRRNLAFVPKLWRARREAIALLRRLQPKVVVSVGGYASMPAVLAARSLKIPIVVVSYDRFPGRASALTARFAAACAVAFPDSSLPRATLTGAPLRRAVLDVDRAANRQEARRALMLPDDRFVLAVMGGSQGSGVLNGAVQALLEARAGDTDLAIRHVVGERFLSASSPARDGSAGVLYQPIGYEADMPAVYGAADLLLARGGSSTVHEVAATGIPAVLVPWAESAEDHQRANVKWLSDARGAVLLDETELAGLPALLDELRRDPDRRAQLSANASRLGEVHRGGGLAGLIESVALA